MTRYAVVAWVVLHGLNVYALPTSYDLRNVQGESFMSSVKNQSGGTCWTHGSMAAIESNLMVTDVWKNNGESGEAALAEYHLDWWNGFNKAFNQDISPKTGGLTVHQGGDYRVAAAYFARGDGSVRDIDGQSYSSPPKQTAAGYHHYYVNQIVWLNAGEDLSTIDEMKQAIIDHGALGTALTSSNSFLSNNNHYQPPSSGSDPNHAVAIAGWDDNHKTQAPKPGAWLIKNSWGANSGDKGYFWISYYDKIAGHHAQMGAVSFQNVEPLKYDHIYVHDYHGWRDTKPNISDAMNVFTSKQKEMLTAVSFYTAKHNVEYTVQVYTAFPDQKGTEKLVSLQNGVAKYTGFHTVPLNWPVTLKAGDKFYIRIMLSDGGHPFDKTSNVPVLLCGGLERPMVESKASKDESYYWNGTTWVDFTTVESTGNFCIKGLTVEG